MRNLQAAAGAVAGATILASIVTAVPASASPSAAYIREGSRGTGVSCVQLALNAEDHAGLSVDGVDGPLTTRAVENFQRQQGLLQVDGIVGPATGTLVWDEDYSLGQRYCYQYIPTYV